MKHKPCNKKLYTFRVPDNLVPHLSVNDIVLCDTRRGEQLGRVMHIISRPNFFETYHSDILHIIHQSKNWNAVNLNVEDFL